MARTKQLFLSKIQQYLFPPARSVFTNASPMRVSSPQSWTKMEVSNGISENGVIFEEGQDRVMQLSPQNLESAARHGARILSSGGLIATPTDTVYGIAGDAQNDQAISKIYEIKGRHSDKPVAICVSTIDQVYQWGQVKCCRTLLEDLLPGPVTLCFERQSVLNPGLNPNTNLIGIRIPDHNFIRMLAQFHSGPVALTSANFSNDPSTLAIHEFKPMWPSLQTVFDGGRLSSCKKSEAAARAGSTVIDLSVEGHFKIIRDGTAYSQCVNLLKNKFHLKEVAK